MPYMISSRSVTDGVSLLVVKSKLVYTSMILVDNKLTLICRPYINIVTTGNSFCPLYTSYFTYLVSSLIFEQKPSRQIGRMTQSTILPVTLPNVHRF